MNPPLSPTPRRTDQEQRTTVTGNSSHDTRDRGRLGQTFQKNKNAHRSCRPERNDPPHRHVPSQQTLPQNVTDWREASHCLISIQEPRHGTWGMEAMSKEKARHGSALCVPSAALAPSPPSCWQEARTTDGPEGHRDMGKTCGSVFAHQPLPAAAFGAWKREGGGWMHRSAELYESSSQL